MYVLLGMHACVALTSLGACILQTEGVTPLHLTTRAGDAEAIALLLSHGADPNAQITVRITVLPDDQMAGVACIIHVWQPA